MREPFLIFTKLCQTFFSLNHNQLSANIDLHCFLCILLIRKSSLQLLQSEVEEVKMLIYGEIGLVLRIWIAFATGFYISKLDNGIKTYLLSERYG
jgi:hypothetical protein